MTRTMEVRNGKNSLWMAFFTSMLIGVFAMLNIANMTVFQEALQSGWEKLVAEAFIPTREGIEVIGLLLLIAGIVFVFAKLIAETIDGITNINWEKIEAIDWTERKIAFHSNLMVAAIPFMITMVIVNYCGLTGNMSLYVYLLGGGIAGLVAVCAQSAWLHQRAK